MLIFWILSEKIEYKTNAISRIIMSVDVSILQILLYPFGWVERFEFGI